MTKLKQKENVLSTLATHKNHLCQKYPISRLALFGSYARNEQTKDSDIDIFVDFAEPIGMEIVDLVLDLEHLLGKKVDILTYEAAKNRLLPYIKMDLIYV